MTTGNIKSQRLIPVFRVQDGQGPRIVNHVSLGGRLGEILRALVDEGFGGIRISFDLQDGFTCSVDLSTPAGSFFEWMYRRAMLGYQLPEPELAVAHLRDFLITLGGAA